MEQFAIHRQRSGRHAGGLLVILQHDFVDALETCVVAPLIPIGLLLVLPRLRPTLTVEGRRYVLALDRLATLDRQTIGEAAGNALSCRDEIFLALDLLFKGF